MSTLCVYGSALKLSLNYIRKMFAICTAMSTLFVYGSALELSPDYIRKMFCNATFLFQKKEAEKASIDDNAFAELEKDFQEVSRVNLCRIVLLLPFEYYMRHFYSLSILTNIG